MRPPLLSGPILSAFGLRPRGESQAARHFTQGALSGFYLDLNSEEEPCRLCGAEEAAFGGSLWWFLYEGYGDWETVRNAAPSGFCTYHLSLLLRPENRAQLAGMAQIMLGVAASRLDQGERLLRAPPGLPGTRGARLRRIVRPGRCPLCHSHAIVRTSVCDALLGRLYSRRITAADMALCAVHRRVLFMQIREAVRITGTGEWKGRLERALELATMADVGVRWPAARPLQGGPSPARADIIAFAGCRGCLAVFEAGRNPENAVGRCAAHLDDEGTDVGEAGSCRRCRVAESAAEAWLSALEGDEPAACLPHTLLSCCHLSSPTAVAAIRCARGTAQRLLESIGEFFRKSDYRFADEPRGLEQLAGLEAFRFLCGEAPPPVGGALMILKRAERPGSGLTA